MDFQKQYLESMKSQEKIKFVEISADSNKNVMLFCIHFYVTFYMGIIKFDDVRENDN